MKGGITRGKCSPFVAGFGVRGATPCTPAAWQGGLAGSKKVSGAEKSFGHGSRDGREKVLMGAVSIRQIVSLQPPILILLLPGAAQSEMAMEITAWLYVEQQNWTTSQIARARYIVSICIFLCSWTSIMWSKKAIRDGCNTVVL